MDKTELLEALEDGRQELLEMIEDLPDEALLEPGVEGEWSIKDILAHLTYWEGQIVTLLYQVSRGMPQPSTAHFGEESVDALNARWQEQNKSRSLEMIWNDFLGVRKQTIRRVLEMSEADLTDPNRYPWAKGVALIEWVANDSVLHEEEHADSIREWLDRRDAKANGSA
jgi:hypothetical protein